MRGDIFHILNRGVEKRKIFYSEKDYLRFAHNLFDFNSTKYAFPYPFRCKVRNDRQEKADNHNRLVELLCWCLMPNHSHNLTQEIVDGGASIFSKKIFGGYTKYINENYERSGVLFQGKSKIIKIKRDPHFFLLPFYIMANPIDLVEPNWKEKGIKNLEQVINFLENYQWSSFPDLIGKKSFLSLISKNLFYDFFQTTEEKFRKDFIEWLDSFKKNNNSTNFID